MSKQAAGRYYRRHRRIPIMTDGAPGPEVSALITRYRYGVRRRKPHYVYYYDGRLYTAKNVPTERDESGAVTGWTWCLVPITSATCWDAYARQTAEEGGAVVTLTVKDGRAVAAVGCKGTPYEGAPLLDGSEPADYVAELLGLERPRKAAPYRPRHMRAA